VVVTRVTRVTRGGSVVQVGVVGEYGGGGATFRFACWFIIYVNIFLAELSVLAHGELAYAL
jgi:hypothetical protein